MENNELEAMKGPGRFQWNFGGWFGSLLGGTAWLIVLGVVVLSSDAVTGLTFILLGTLAVILGIFLWARRNSILPYVAMQQIITVLFIVTTVALIVADFRGTLELLNHSSRNPRFTYFTLLLFPALMLQFHFTEKRGSNKADEDAI